MKQTKKVVAQVSGGDATTVTLHPTETLRAYGGGATGDDEDLL